MKLKNNGDTPQKLIREALQASAKVDNLEAANASLEEIEEAEEIVRQISQMISYLHQLKAGIISDANSNNFHYIGEKQ